MHLSKLKSIIVLKIPYTTQVQLYDILYTSKNYRKNTLVLTEGKEEGKINECSRVFLVHENILHTILMVGG